MITGKQFIEHLYSCTEEQREFGVVKKKNRAAKKAWENRMAGIDNPNVSKIIDNPDNSFGYNRFVPEDFDYDKFDDSRNSARLRKMDHKIRQNSGDRKILNPEYAENIEKKTRFREENSGGDTINKKFKKKKEKILMRRQYEKAEREAKEQAEEIARNEARLRARELKRMAEMKKKMIKGGKKVAKVAIPVAAISGLGYLGYKKYKKK